MHQRIFHYAMLVYAFGFIAALTLNIDIPEQTARAPVRTAEQELPSAGSNALMNCSAQPDVHVVASASPSVPSPGQVGAKAACAPRVLEVMPVPGALAPKPAPVPIAEPLVRQDL
jgi:hypothetical protein